MRAEFHTTLTFVISVYKSVYILFFFFFSPLCRFSNIRKDRHLGLFYETLPFFHLTMTIWYLCIPDLNLMCDLFFSKRKVNKYLKFYPRESVQLNQDAQVNRQHSSQVNPYMQYFTSNQILSVAFIVSQNHQKMPFLAALWYWQLLLWKSKWQFQSVTCMNPLNRFRYTWDIRMCECL